MPELDMDQATTGNLENTGTNFEITPQETIGPSDRKENRYTNQLWDLQHGAYRKISELGSAIDAETIWTIGKGSLADDRTKDILDRIRGTGKDTFNEILGNCFKVAVIGGDSFAEIILDDEDGELFNLKPLNPSSMTTIANGEGIIIGYEQRRTDKSIKKYKPKQIFHLMRNRIASEFNGISIYEKLETNVIMRNEAMDDEKKLMHRHVKPMVKFILDTDKQSKIDTLIETFDKATNEGENLYIPKGTVEHEIISVPANATLNPLPWISYLIQEFHRATGGTDIVLGGSGEFTDATGKIKYLAFEQNIKRNQLWLEEQAFAQLELTINLEFPASLQNDLLSDSGKDVQSGAVQKNDVTAGSGE